MFDLEMLQMDFKKITQPDLQIKKLDPLGFLSL